MLNENERLSIPHAGHESKQTKYGITRYWTRASKFDLMNRLGEYEDTELTSLDVLTLILLFTDLSHIIAVPVGDDAFYVTGCGLKTFNDILNEIRKIVGVKP